MIHIYNDQENNASVFNKQAVTKSTNSGAPNQFISKPIAKNPLSNTQFTGVNVKNNKAFGATDKDISLSLKGGEVRKPLQAQYETQSSAAINSQAPQQKERIRSLDPKCQQEIERLGGTITSERKYRTYKMPPPIAEFVNVQWNQKWFFSQQYNIKVEMVGYFRLYPEDYEHMPLLMKHKDDHYLIADGDGCLMVLANDTSSDPTIHIAGDEDTLGIYPFNMPIKLSKFLATLKPMQSTSDALFSQIVPEQDEDKMQIVQTPASCSAPAQKQQNLMNSPRIDDLYENDAQDVTDYIKDVMTNLKSREHAHQVINYDYLKRQEKINNSMRFVLIDWLLEVHKKVKLFPETMYLCVNILDRFLERQPVSKDKFQLVGATALFIASKYEDIYHIDIDGLIKLCADIYTRDDFLMMESVMLSALEYNLTVVTSWPFIERFVRCADCSEKGQLMAYYFSELAFLDEKFLQYEPSRIASSCILLASIMDRVQSPWSEVMQYYSGYEREDLLPCCRLLLEMARKEPKGMNKKYQKNKYMQLAYFVPNFARELEL